MQAGSSRQRTLGRCRFRRAAAMMDVCWNRNTEEAMSAFRDSAELYEILANAAKRLEREGPFLLDCLGRAPGSRVLDLACGTGIHALFFAGHGADVTACDVSKEMIDHAARTRPHPSIRYEVGDMRRLTEGTWDLIVCLGNSLSLLHDADELDATLAGVRDHLGKGGLFLSQTLNYASEAAQSPRHRIERAPIENGEVVVAKDLVPHGDRTFLAMSFFVDQASRVDTVSETAVLRNWRFEELGEAAERAGLRMEGVFGGFDRSPYDPRSSGDLIALFAQATPQAR